MELSSLEGDRKNNNGAIVPKVDYADSAIFMKSMSVSNNGPIIRLRISGANGVEYEFSALTATPIGIVLKTMDRMMESTAALLERQAHRVQQSQNEQGN